MLLTDVCLRRGPTRLECVYCKPGEKLKRVMVCRSQVEYMKSRPGQSHECVSSTSKQWSRKDAAICRLNKVLSLFKSMSASLTAVQCLPHYLPSHALLRGCCPNVKAGLNRLSPPTERLSRISLLESQPRQAGLVFCTVESTPQAMFVFALIRPGS